eukprot:CAMPEP_0202925196 /NCGR_PEP_ID=MMETSP1392-20130828/79367_1 /ASSEMBLY_ACC=CAM_ASM_000868 /TAXON_ID=225041 /ORGANISM="Chlamydomonas chlamydogama, Strain SAG 11-48b" /LENGTH=195 /DNA_ID=CAMNT_0049618959 /DNA_START=762 /DNA_END=1351 /DNA_ORIENTATION=-
MVSTLHHNGQGATATASRATQHHLGTAAVQVPHGTAVEDVQSGHMCQYGGDIPPYVLYTLQHRSILCMHKRAMALGGQTNILPPALTNKQVQYCGAPDKSVEKSSQAHTDSPVRQPHVLSSTYSPPRRMWQATMLRVKDLQGFAVCTKDTPYQLNMQNMKFKLLLQLQPVTFHVATMTQQSDQLVPTSYHMQALL